MRPGNQSSVATGTLSATSTSANASAQITQILEAWRLGDRDAGDRLVDQSYRHLRRLAASQLSRSDSNVSLQPTELLSELFVKLTARRVPLEFVNRNHFYGMASNLMREIVIDRIRRKQRVKRAGKSVQLDLDIAVDDDFIQESDVLAVREALDSLRAVSKRAAEITELRYFSGLTIDETAERLGIGRATVVRNWRYARAWLRRRLLSGTEH